MEHESWLLGIMSGSTRFNVAVLLSLLENGNRDPLMWFLFGRAPRLRPVERTWRLRVLATGSRTVVITDLQGPSVELASF